LLALAGILPASIIENAFLAQASIISLRHTHRLAGKMPALSLSIRIEKEEKA